MAIIATERQYNHTLKKIKEMKDQESIMEQDLLEKAGKEVLSDFKKAGLFGVTHLREQMEYEVKEYESIKKGDIPEYMKKMDNLGLLLIALRIKKGWSQTELAKKIGVAQSQVARDEYNEYHGISLTRVKKLLKVYDEEIILEID